MEPAKEKHWFKKLLHKDTIQVIYLVIGIASGLGGLAAYIKSNDEKKEDKQQIIIIRDSKDNKTESKIEPKAEITSKDFPIKESINISREDYQINQKPQVNSLIPIVPIERTIEPAKKNVDETEEDFGIIRNKRKSETSNVSEKNEINIIVPALVYGDFKVENGASIRVRIGEGIIYEGQSIERNTAFSGTMTIKDKRVFIEFNNKSLPVRLYALDKEKNQGLNVQDYFKDGYKIYLSNKY